MTDDELAARAVAVSEIEASARASWDAIAQTDNAGEYQAAMSVTRQAGALRRALEQWIVARATSAHRAAVAR